MAHPKPRVRFSIFLKRNSLHPSFSNDYFFIAPQSYHRVRVVVAVGIVIRNALWIESQSLIDPIAIMYDLLI